MTREEAHEELHFGERLDYISFNELHMGIEQIYEYFESREKEYQKKLIEANERADKFLKEKRELATKADILRNIEFVIANPDATVRKG